LDFGDALGLPPLKGEKTRLGRRPISDIVQNFTTVDRIVAEISVPGRKEIHSKLNIQQNAVLAFAG